MYNAIGGYFELAEREDAEYPFAAGVLLNTGRNCIEYILRSIGDVKKVYLPYYTCNVVLEPLDKLGVQYVYYHVNWNFELVEDIELNDGEYIIVNNYFGVKDAYIQTLARKYGNHLIVDNTQALYAACPQNAHAAYSFRKYIGVADGALVYTDNGLRTSLFDIDDSSDRISHLIIRKEQSAEEGFLAYQENDKKLNGLPIRRISTYTEDQVKHIDYGRVRKIRRQNYAYLHKHLSDINQLSLPDMDTFECPMVYPFVCVEEGLRQRLISNRVYVARYWPNVIDDKAFEEEVVMANRIIPIPIDQRYGFEEMERIVKLVTQGI